MVERRQQIGDEQYRHQGDEERPDQTEGDATAVRTHAAKLAMRTALDDAPE
jgi:hypothetical protein